VFLSAGLFLLGLQLLPVLVAAPLPLLRLGLRKGAAIQAAGASLSLLVVAGIALLLGQSVEAMAIGVALFAAVVLLPVRLALRGVLSGWGVGRTLVSILAAETAWAVAAIAAVVRRSGISPTKELLATFDETRVQVLSTLAGAGLSPEKLAELDRGLREAAQFWSERFLVILVIAGGIGLAFVLGLVPRLSGRPEETPFREFRFEELRNPFVIVFGFILGGIGMVFGGGVTRLVAANVLSAVTFLCFLQGFSVVYAFLTRIPVGRLFRFLVYFLMIQFPVSLAVAGIGLFDGFFEFRRYRP
jgi:uncharacterized protein YybS (DUF2232 family)